MVASANVAAVDEESGPVDRRACRPPEWPKVWEKVWVTVWIEEKGEKMELLTNRFDLSAETIEVREISGPRTTKNKTL